MNNKTRQERQERWERSKVLLTYLFYCGPTMTPPRWKCWLFGIPHDKERADKLVQEAKELFGK